ncbi:MAG: hypothetical protein ACJ0K4_10720 [Verrucomicrobiales bacterium]
MLGKRSGDFDPSEVALEPAKAYAVMLVTLAGIVYSFLVVPGGAVGSSVFSVSYGLAATTAGIRIA